MWGQVMLLAFLLITSNHSWEVLVLRWDMLLCCWWSLLSGAAIALGVCIWFATIFRWVVPVNNVHTDPRIQKFPAEYSIYEIQHDDQCYLLLLSVVLILWLIGVNSIMKPHHQHLPETVWTKLNIVIVMIKWWLTVESKHRYTILAKWFEDFWKTHTCLCRIT